jgi:hypothetical protein
MANTAREVPGAAEPAVGTRAPHVPSGLGSPLTSLQRALGNRAVGRLLARQQAPADGKAAETSAGAPALPHPGDQPAHREAFDALTAAIVGASTVADLTAARAASDGPAFGGEKTLSYAGRQLIVDQANATEILTRIRWRALDRVHQIATARRAEEAAATTGQVREAAKIALVSDATPYLDFLAGPILDPASLQNRYQHWFDVVEASVLLVIQLRAVRVAQTVGLDADGKGKTRGDLKAEVGRMGDKPWCGAFADYVYRQVGLRSAAAGGQLDGEGGVLAFFGYGDAVSKQAISTGGRKVTVKDYHAERHSRRRMQVIDNRPGPNGQPTPGFSAAGASRVQREAVDIAPGDILLLDNLKGNRPDHIMIATAYDAAAHKVSKIAGNEVDNPGRVNTGTFDIGNQPDAIPPDKHALYVNAAALEAKKTANDAAKPWTSDDERALAAVKAQISTFETNQEFFSGGSKISRIAAVCRFSIVDFEQHDYVAP